MAHLELQRNTEPGHSVKFILRPDYEVDYLAQLLHVSPSVVVEAIASAGTNRHKVKKYIKKVLHKDRK